MQRVSPTGMRGLWLQKRVQAIAAQAIVLIAAAALGAWLIGNTLCNLARRGIASGFGFLDQTAGFDIVFHLVEYSALSTYGRAFLVGLLNTLLVAALGIVFATVIGFAVGVARLSGNWLIARLAGVYIEILRNVPLLLQIFFWYFAVLSAMPHPRESHSLFGLAFLNSRGLYLPKPVFDGASLSWSLPELQGFNFTGGMVLIPEFVALATALTLYTAAFVAELVRAGILSVPRGQTAAAAALGLTPRQTLRHVVIPQALRLIVPPLAGHYLSLTKNSSLATAIGYPELVSVFAGTVLNQTGQAVEIVAVTMAVYLTISLAIAAAMNLYNRRVLRGGG